MTPAPTPTQAPAARTPTVTSIEGLFDSISAGWKQTCGLRRDGTVICQGNNDRGQSSPLEKTFVSFSAGGEHTCEIKEDGSVACLG